MTIPFQSVIRVMDCRAGHDKPARSNLRGKIVRAPSAQKQSSASKIDGFDIVATGVQNKAPAKLSTGKKNALRTSQCLSSKCSGFGRQAAEGA